MPVHIVLCAGQSNMVGFGTEGSDPEKDNWHPRIWDMPGGDFAKRASVSHKINVANEPTQYSEIEAEKVSPAMACARRIVAAHPNERVLLVPMAKGGTALIGADAEWNPDTTEPDTLRQMYTRLVSRYNAAITALAGASVASVSLIWSQGEADGTAVGYESAFATMRSRLMTDIGVTEMPTIILGRTIPDPINAPDLVAVQQKLDQDSGDAAAIGDVVYFDLAGSQWTNAGDDIHFTSEAQRIRGDYAGQLLAHRLANNVGDWPGPRTIN